MGETIKMRFTLIRHGETDANVQKLSQGHLESILTVRGIEQTKKLAERLKDEHFNFAYISDLQRTRDTANIVLENDHNNTERILTANLREQCKGKYEGWTIKDREDDIKRIIKEEGKEYSEEYHLFKPADGVGLDNTSNNKKRFYLGESVKEMQDRIVSFYYSLLNMHINDNILLVSSGMAIGSLVSYFNNQSLKDIKTSIPENGSVTIYEANNISNPREAKEISYNDIRHIGEGGFTKVKGLYGV
ncbi:histidine phosphatase family protein [Candidatus Woesearchaeota archaeon]|nr:histidine phosphatase family protein [Candidatus Woesearchaeota archaeon]